MGFSKEVVLSINYNNPIKIKRGDNLD